MTSTYSNLVKLYELMVVQSYAREQEKTKRSKSQIVKITGTTLCCLVCRGQDNLVKLRYEPDVGSCGQDVSVENYIEMIHICFNIEIKDEEGGGCICEGCIERLRDALDFKRRLEEAEEVLLQAETNNMNVFNLDGSGDVKPQLISNDFTANEADIMPPRLKPKTTQCPVCAEYHFNFSTLKSHYAAHFHPYLVCPHCGKRFFIQRQLADHIRSYHKKTALTCPVCDKSFASDAVLRRHIGSVHENGTETTCNLCSESFETCDDLNEHRFQMHKEKYEEHNCKICGKNFFTASGLHYHLKEVHVENRKFACTECNYRSASKFSLRRHKMTHSSGTIPCPQCDRMFKSTTTLAEHAKVHTNKKNYQCTSCGSCFGQARTLASHMFRVHNIRYQ